VLVVDVLCCSSVTPAVLVVDACSRDRSFTAAHYLKFVLGEAAEGVAALKAAEFASAYVPLPFLRVCLPSPLQIIVVLL
jgi:hypothetical protein